MYALFTIHVVFACHVKSSEMRTPRQNQTKTHLCIKGCTPLHSQPHLLSGNFPSVRDLLEDCDQEDDQSLAVFFKRVVARNMEINIDDEG